MSSCDKPHPQTLMQVAPPSEPTEHPKRLSLALEIQGSQCGFSNTPSPACTHVQVSPVAAPPATPSPRDLSPPWHSLVQDVVEIESSFAGGLLLSTQQAPRTIEHHQPQPEEQPAPGTAGQGQLGHHPLARGWQLSADNPPWALLGGEKLVRGTWNASWSCGGKQLGRWSLGQRDPVIDRGREEGRKGGPRRTKGNSATG